MKPSVTVLAVLALAASASGAAGAAARAVPCRTIIDPLHDSGRGKSLDIASGDIASNARTVTVAFRVAEVARHNTSAPGGQAYYFHFSAGGETPIYLSYSVTPTSTDVFTYGWVDGSVHNALGRATGIVDVTRKEVRISAPIGAWAGYGTPRVGARITNLAMRTYWVVGAYVSVPQAGTNGFGSLQGADVALGGTYVGGTPSCVIPGT